METKNWYLPFDLMCKQKQDLAFDHLVAYFSRKYPQCSGDFKIKTMQNLTQEYSLRMPKLGEIVIFFPNPDDNVARSNGNSVCAAIVTNVWSSIVVNIKIVPDHGAMQDRGSVSHFSANPAGYHFMFQEEYQTYLTKGIKDFSEIKKQLVEDAETLIEEAKSHLKKATEARVKAKEKVTAAGDLKIPIQERFGPTY